MSHESRQSVTIAILAGGKSRRMGTDKALLTVDGEMMLARTARIALKTDAPVIVVGRESPAGWPYPNVTFVPDTFNAGDLADSVIDSQPRSSAGAPGFGPIGGLLAALRYAGGSVLLLACDLPRLTPDSLTWLIDNYNDMTDIPPGVAARSDGQFEPLFSIYTQQLIPAIEGRIDIEQLSMKGLIESGGFAMVDVPATHLPALANANTRDEWTEIISS